MAGLRWLGADPPEGVPKPPLEALLEYYGSRVGKERDVTNCPLHEDRTPSLSYDTARNLWNCFSCGRGGDSLTLIEKMEGVDFAGARE